MRFTMSAAGLIQKPTDGAIIPELAKRGADTVFDGISDTITTWLSAGAHWLATDGIQLFAEGFLLWGMICFLIACTGSATWLEKGAKSMVLSALLGVLKYAAVFQ